MKTRDFVVYSCIVAFWVTVVGIILVPALMPGYFPVNWMNRMIAFGLLAGVGFYASLFLYLRTRTMSRRGEFYFFFLAATFTGILLGVGILLSFLPLTLLTLLGQLIGIPMVLSIYLQLYLAHLGLFMTILGIVLAIIQIAFAREIAAKMNNEIIRTAKS